MDSIWQTLLTNVPFLVAFMVWEMDRSKRDREERALRDAAWQKTMEALQGTQTERDGMWRMWLTQSQAAQEKFMESLGRQLESLDASMDARYAQIGEQIAACQTDFKASSIKFSQMEVQVSIQLDAMYRVMARLFPEVIDASATPTSRRRNTGELVKKS